MTWHRRVDKPLSAPMFTDVSTSYGPSLRPQVWCRHFPRIMLSYWTVKRGSWGSQGTSHHYNALTMSAMATQITSLAIVYSIVDSGVGQRKHQSSASLAFVLGITGEFPAQMASNAEMFPFDDVIMMWWVWWWWWCKQQPPTMTCSLIQYSVQTEVISIYDTHRVPHGMAWVNLLAKSHVLCRLPLRRRRLISMTKTLLRESMPWTPASNSS